VIEGPGLDPAWSRFIGAPDHRGKPVTWHVLDTHHEPSAMRATVLALHGNPTWSYLWRGVLAAAPPDIRVIAVDHLDMGWSERTGVPRRLADRIADIDALLPALQITGPLVLLAHDWGGPIALGLAQRHRVAGIALANTAVDRTARAPRLIRAARRVLNSVTIRTDIFVRAPAWLSSLPSPVAHAYRAPYQDAERRRAIRDFVADIPFTDDHPTAATLQTIAAGLEQFAHTPVLLVWGAKDPVFAERYLHDLERRLPHARVERVAKASHLVPEEVSGFGAMVMQWIESDVLGHAAQPPTATSQRLWDPIMERAQLDAVAITWVEHGRARCIPWRQLADRVTQLARGFAERGIRPGDRVALLIPPSPDLIAVVYALWRIGAAAVIADSGLGVRRLRRAIGSAGVQHVIGIPKGLMLARTLTIPGQRISTAELVNIARSTAPEPELPGAEREAVVVFTSGATGPAKGVVYRQGQVERTRDAIAATYDITDADALVAAFAPWAVLGPALGVRSAIPDMDVTAPRTLRATALADAALAVHGTFTWASPAALRNVVATVADLNADQRAALAGLRLVLAAGAPVAPALLRAAVDVFPNARIGTPYGMTEVLPVCHVDYAELKEAGAGNGVLVGAPIAGVQIRIAPLADGPTGEILVSAPHMRDRYDRRASLEVIAPAGWHATGDVGHLDDQGRLWIEGRLVHVVHTADGPVTPVGAEQVLELDPAVDAAAIVGVGPVGNQQVIGIVVLHESTSDVVADAELTQRLREAVHSKLGITLSAVLVRMSLPTDIRHNAKIDRTALSSWASDVLAGRQ
jgi:acyl-coenzyme A synthetase/AMP-(fatty) acid ligase/pimeloyl-ACP methyl ester carboxylesterase